MQQATRDVTEKKEGNLPAKIDFISDAGAGLENIDKDDLALPFLKLLQTGSDETKKKHANYVDGAEDGMFYNTVTKKLYSGEKGIEVIPCFYKLTFPEWAPFERKEGRPVHQFEPDPKTNKNVSAPMFSRIYKLNSVENSGSFTWHGYKVSLLRKVDNAAIYQMAREFHNSLKKSNAAISREKEKTNY
jgi:hypothetical protein